MDKFQQLAALGAGEFSHLNGSLIEHLKGTKKLLCDWGASSGLQDAGLYHAAYGTDGFDEQLVSVKYRDNIREIVGKDAEEIIYQYCACDREAFFLNLEMDKPVFKNRFTGESYLLSETMLQMFCELTAANETEIAIASAEFKAEYGEALRRLFVKMTPYLSDKAIEGTAREFSKQGSQLG